MYSKSINIVVFLSCLHNNQEHYVTELWIFESVSMFKTITFHFYWIKKIDIINLWRYIMESNNFFYGLYKY